MAITTEDELRAIYGHAKGRAATKMIDHVDHHCRAFIDASPFLLLATSNGTSLDVSPKGDPAGCVVVEDDGRHVLLADRPGNNRIDGLVNIVAHPEVALLFLIPTVRETLRVTGRATIHDEPEILDRCLVNGRRPITVTRVAVTEAGLHCAKAFLRSGLWQPETWPESRPVPSLSDILLDHTGSREGYADEAEMTKRYAETLY